MAKREAITAGYVRSILHYNPETGVFTWRERPREHFKSDQYYRSWNSRYAGSIAGAIMNMGYISISINKTRYLAHRLAWLLVTGAWPENLIDHIDMCKKNNSWVNLRGATYSQNFCNQRMHSDNLSGFKGVRKARNKWSANIQVNKKLFYLGVFDTREQASAAYERAAIIVHGEFART